MQHDMLGAIVEARGVFRPATRQTTFVNFPLHVIILNKMSSERNLRPA